MKNSYIFTIFLIFAVVKFNSAIPDDMREKFINAVTHCSKQNGVTNEQLEHFHKGEFEDATHDLKCFVKCFANILQYVVGGEPQIDEMKKSFSNVPNFNMEKFDKATEDCKSSLMIEGDECERVFNYMACRRNAFQV